jgi:AraC family transcriptional regulator
MNGSKAYGERFAKVCDYIDEHLGEDLSIERLSQVANFSKFHFHRLFSNYAGTSVSRYIQMIRFNRASCRLVFEPHVQIIEIALEAGFENPESFPPHSSALLDRRPLNSGSTRLGSPGVSDISSRQGRGVASWT